MPKPNGHPETLAPPPARKTRRTKHGIYSPRLLASRARAEFARELPGEAGLAAEIRRRLAEAES